MLVCYNIDMDISKQTLPKSPNPKLTEDLEGRGGPAEVGRPTDGQDVGVHAGAVQIEVQGLPGDAVKIPVGHYALTASGIDKN